MSASHPLFTVISLVALFVRAGAQETSRLSVDSAGAQANDWSETYGERQSVSADGNLVAFSSGATNLVAGDTNGVEDVFVHDRTTGVTERVSVDSAGAQANGYSWDAQISADGRFVVFSSEATNLVPGDTNGYGDVFVHDRVTGITERVSVDSNGAQADGGSGNDGSPNVISADDRYVAFTSGASNLVSGDTNFNWDVFVHDRTTGVTERVSVSSAGAQGDLESKLEGMSSDGRFVVFHSFARNLIPGDTNACPDVFVHDRTTGTTERVSVSSAGAQANDSSFAAAISADGQVVAFASYATNLVSGDTNGVLDVFVHDRTTGITERVSVDSSGVQGNADSDVPTISADHRFVAFSSKATNLVAGDTNGKTDVFVHDRTAGTTQRVSVDSSGTQANANSFDPSISADGELVLFSSDASNLVAGDTNGTTDVFLRDRCDAYWSNYGAGLAGTNGVPSFTSRSDPVLGSTVTLDLADSAPGSTVGLLFIGFQQTAIHSSWGGDLLVVPFLTLLVNVPAGGATLSGAIPNDDSLCGLAIDLQALESDAGAAKGVSFTPGLELVLGR